LDEAKNDTIGKGYGTGTKERGPEKSCFGPEHLKKRRGIKET